MALVTPQVQAGRADYRRPELPDMIEWYMNRRDALEQGVTLVVLADLHDASPAAD